jgi:hypothetical protein
MLHPTYKIEAAGTLNPDSSDVSSITVNLSMDEPIDIFEGSIKFRGQAESPRVTKGTDVTVYLGYDDNLTDAFEGNIDAFHFRYPKFYVHAVSDMFLLTLKRFDKFYEQQTAGAIVKDLCQSAGVEVDDVSDGVQLPYYAVDSNRNVYEHVRYLAGISGFDVYTTNKNKLVFKKFQAKEKHVIEYGKNLIKLNKVEQTKVIDSVKVFGESPSSSQGSQTTHWLTKQKVQGTAGNEGGNEIIIEDRVIKDEDTAKHVADAVFERLNSGIFFITTEVLGNPKIMLGDSVTIKGMPYDPINGEYQARSVEHYFSKTSGFITTIKCRGTPEGVSTY